MEITVHFNKDLGIVVTTPVGIANRPNILKTYEEATKVSIEHNCLLMLFDIRQCPLGQTLTQAFGLMKDLTQIPGLTYDRKTAVVYDPAIYPVDRATFIDNVVSNRSNPKFKMFDSMDEAIAWLRSK